MHVISGKEQARSVYSNHTTAALSFFTLTDRSRLLNSSERQSLRCVVTHHFFIKQSCSIRSVYKLALNKQYLPKRGKVNRKGFIFRV